MNIPANLPLVEEILAEFRETVGNDFAGYRNHVYRVSIFCCSLGPFSEQEREKIQIAACFHDLGIWTAGTLDYLPPSQLLASRYLTSAGRAA